MKHAFVLLLVSSAWAAPPWTPQYKIKPSEKNRLTAADVVGPDGLVYPNWTRVGVEGGIPDVKAVATIEDFGGKANDDADDSEALDHACRMMGENGGGAIVLGEGTYHLDRPVTVRHDGVVIRGKGRDKTKIVFRYAVDDSGASFFWPKPGSRVGPYSLIEAHAQPSGLQKMALRVDGATVGEWTRGKHSGNTFWFRKSGRDVLAKAKPGERTLELVATYSGGKTRSATMPVVLDPACRDEKLAPESGGAITFLGKGAVAPRIPLTRDAKRGDTVLQVKDATGFKAGDAVEIDGPATDRWKKLTQNACTWGIYRRTQARIASVEGNAVTLEQPVRIEFPVVDGSNIVKLAPVQRCGVEDLTIVQTENLWITAVWFRHAWNCWARGVRVSKCGRHAVYAREAKWCEVRDCVFDDAWFKGGGGTAYSGWEISWDCLMEDCETFKLRHAPVVQWGSSGNVIRRSVFHDSDGQWHAGWTNENLFEQCVITSRRGNGGYGFGMWGSPPNDTAHGPNGPRNVVYNCDVTSQKTGLWMGGMNEGWLILHNRFDVERGQGVYAQRTSFDHTIRGNVFILRDGKSPMAILATPDCTGVEIEGNTLYGGNGKICEGAGKPFVLRDNQAKPLGDAPRPTPAVPSIYEWQKANVRK